MERLANGARVVVSPQAYPRERWPGVIERRTPNGYRVAYECHGATFRETFTARELAPA